MDFVIKGVYSFNVYPVAVLGTAFENVTVMAVFDQETANAQGFDTVANHALVYPTLPPGSPNDPSLYNYVKIRTPSGKTQILGLPWIIEDSVQTVQLGTISLKISNVNSSSQNKIRQILAANGYNAVDLSFH